MRIMRSAYVGEVALEIPYVEGEFTGEGMTNQGKNNETLDVKLVKWMTEKGRPEHLRRFYKTTLKYC
ncbi:hypothetical protein E3N88_12343 [Mikania micrantha]|uniref:Uncharacterized protein n=1 Tax=Mikania micrantha TaxID=192012 RepID=A0A5N6P588_9ASTR|nr:hypothetical protein E3N88_12343 [Mikania micrantha]